MKTLINSEPGNICAAVSSSSQCLWGTMLKMTTGKSNRKEQIFGGVAQVFTAYGYRFSEDGPIEKKGINCINLAFEQGRWWITNIIWEAESDQLEMPKWALKGMKKKKKK